MANPRWTWDVDLEPVVGGTVRFETKDGTRREGQATRVVASTMKIDGEQVVVPTGLELNGDSGDVVDFERLLWLETA